MSKRPSEKGSPASRKPKKQASKKRKSAAGKSTNFWLGLLLGAVLGSLLLLLLIGPTEQPAPPPSAVATTPPAGDGASYQPWQMPVATGEKPAVHPPHAGAKPPSEPAPTTTMARKTYGLALIIDDVGYDLHALDRLLRLDVPIAISILPDAPYVAQSIQLTQQHQQTLMLHLPMQPQDPSIQMNAAFLRSDMSKRALQQTFLSDLAAVPGAVGVNNHMGSRLTRQHEAMQWVMSICRDKGLFFVDSRTSGRSVAADEARRARLPWAERQIFLDHEMNYPAMKRAWQHARNCVKKRRRCVVIAHPRPLTVTFLENYLTSADASSMVPIQQLLQGGEEAAP